MTNEQMAARLEEVARDLEGMDSGNLDSPVLRAGAEAIRKLDEMEEEIIRFSSHEPAEPVKCGTFTDQAKIGSVVRVGMDLWKQIRKERNAALREVERLREENRLLRGLGKLSDAMRRAFGAVLNIALRHAPPPPHKGSCGPEAGCDAMCAEYATLMDELRFASKLVDRSVEVAAKITPDPRDARIAELEAALPPDPDEPAAPRIQDGETGVILARVWNHEITPGKAAELLEAQPWTPRERRLRKALDTVRAELAWIIEDTSPSFTDSGGSSTCRAAKSAHAGVVAALAEAPPPDTRDEALEAVVAWLEGHRYCPDCEWRDDQPHAKNCAFAKLAAIARAKGGK